MNKNRSIPVVIVEEHNQAFYAWWWAKEMGYFDGSATLFHFDAHQDMSMPYLDVSVYNAMKYRSREERCRWVKNFVDEHLDIGAFIIPAICAGLIQNIYFLRPDWDNHTQRVKWRKYHRIIGTRGGEGCEFIGGTLNRSLVPPMISWDILPGDYACSDIDSIRKDLHGVLPDAVEYLYVETALDYLPKKKKIIIDIDLDYFSCMRSPAIREPIEIEITEKYYQKHKESQYYPLRYAGFRPQFHKRGEHYFLLLEPFRYTVEDKLNTEIGIKKLVDRVIRSIEKLDCLPYLLTICRSRISGYTHVDQVDFIQATLLEGLSQVIRGHLDVRHYNSI